MGKVVVVGFDWDGTLLDSLFVKAEKFGESVVKFYPEVEKHREEIIKTFISARGHTRYFLLRLIQVKYALEELNDKKLKEWSNLFSSLYQNENMNLINNGAEVLSELKRRGFKTFVSSSVPHKVLLGLLDKYNLARHVDIAMGFRRSDNFEKGSSHFSYVKDELNTNFKKIMYVGDAGYDIRMGKEVGCVTVGFADKRVPFSEEQIRDYEPDYVVHDLKEVIKLV